MPGQFLLCYDGSDAAANAIREAGELTGGGPALVVHAWLPPSAMLLQGRLPPESHPLRPAVDEFDASAREAADRLVSDGVEIAAAAGFEAEGVAIEAPHGTWRPLVALAEEREVRAVVVGSHGVSSTRPMLLGSVSHGIANRCTRPVIVVPFKESEAPAGRGG